jgi:hypothetical protein
MDGLRWIRILGERDTGPDRRRHEPPDQALHFRVLPLADGLPPLLARTVVWMVLGRKVHDRRAHGGR